MNLDRTQPSIASLLLIMLLATISGVAVALTSDASDESNVSASGPGLTFDEGFNVDVGVYLVESNRQMGLAALSPQTQYEIYSHPGYNPDHPPLGRLVLGVANAIGMALFEPDAPDVFVRLTYARWGSAFAFALTVFVIGWYSRWQFGAVAGVASAVSVALMPRLFAHAHLASLETMTGLTYCTCVLWLSRSWTSLKPTWKSAIIPGVLLGLAFLTKMHAIFLPPVIGLWGLWNWRLRAVLPLTVLFSVAFAVFFVGWPWLWIDPVLHLKEYFARSTERATLYCHYFNVHYADKEVPWHYPWVMTIVTVPPLLFIASFIGMFAWRNKSMNATEKVESTGQNAANANAQASQLLVGTMLIPLVVFSLPGVTVYDGARLFLMSFPLLAVWMGNGVQVLIDRFSRRGWVMAAIVLLSPLPSLISLHSCQLSYYSEGIGGLRGASAMGLEPTYWGDAVTSEFMEDSMAQIPIGATLDVAPVLHPLQLKFMQSYSWLQHRPDIQLRGYDDANLSNPNVIQTPYVLVIHRHADPWESLSPPPEGTEVLGSVSKGGVPLSDLLKLPIAD